jgi:glycerophosphoryl diester phosphodiesterase
MLVIDTVMISRGGRGERPIRRVSAVLSSLALAASIPTGAAAPTMAPALQLLDLKRPLVIAHRGDSAAAPENTLRSFAQALTTGADLVELDYHHSRDGVPVVMHDPTLDRTTDAVAQWARKDVRIDQTAAAALQTLDAGAWFGATFAGTRVPLLTEALDTIQRGSVTLIERKAGDADTCARLLRERGLINRVVVQSFDWEFLRALHALEPELALGALGPIGQEKAMNPAHVAAVKELGASVIVWNEAVTPEGVRAAHDDGLRVWVYTIDDPEKARALVALGVDGIITNKPALIRQTLSK